MQCFDALNKSQYSDAIRLLDDGLNQHLISPEQVDVTALIKHVRALINYLEFRLEEDFEIDEHVRREDAKREPRCTFCGARQSEAKRIIAGPGVFICDKCIKQWVS